MIQVFGKPDCPGCKLTIKLLDDEADAYEYFDVTENSWAMDVLKEHDIRSVPVVLSFSHPPIVGFRPETIREVIKAYASDPSLDIEQGAK